jgi:hypothetical protein
MSDYRRMSVPKIKLESSPAAINNLKSTKHLILDSDRLLKKMHSIKSIETNPELRKILKLTGKKSKISESLKGFTDVYKDYAELINPKNNYIDSLSPLKLPKSLKKSPKIEMIPKKTYNNYKLETMAHFKTAEYRIKKAKESIKIAKQLIYKYIT